MTEERIDFNALDPSKSRSTQWEMRIREVARAAFEARLRKPSVWRQLVEWTVPSLAAAVVTAGILLAVALFASELGSTNTVSEPSTETASLVSAWAAGETLPATDRILTILGGSNDSK